MTERGARIVERWKHAMTALAWPLDSEKALDELARAIDHEIGNALFADRAHRKAEELRK